MQRNTGPPQQELPDMFSVGDVIDGQFTVKKKLGRGGYGEIYFCTTKEHSEVALKVERVCKPGNLKEEELILQALKGCMYTPQLLRSGRHEGKITYIAMELLGENLSNLRRQQQTHNFSLLTTLMLARQMLRCLKEVHERGFIHRDIKPGNFVLGTNNHGNPRTIIIIDYGLSKEHLTPSGEVKPERREARWVGSRRYMSLNTHYRRDQARRDDLWSLLYVLIEFRLGTLPWAHLRGPENFTGGMVGVFCVMYNFLGTPTTPFDWETPESALIAVELERKYGFNNDLVYPTLEEAQAFSELPPRGGDRIQRRSQNSTSTSNAPDNTTLKITSNANSTTNTNNALQVKEKAAEGEDCVLF